MLNEDSHLWQQRHLEFALHLADGQRLVQPVAASQDQDLRCAKEKSAKCRKPSLLLLLSPSSPSHLPAFQPAKVTQFAKQNEVGDAFYLS